MLLHMAAPRVKQPAAVRDRAVGGSAAAATGFQTFRNTLPDAGRRMRPLTLQSAIGMR
jgi:hypothetical protein